MTLSDVLKNKKNVHTLEHGVSDDEVTQAEVSLGLCFAKDYIAYLKQYALLSYDAHELTGLCKSQRLNVVDATKREKADNENIMSDMYMIEQIGVENLTIWQNSRSEIFEVPYKAMPRKICDSLLEYVDSY